MSLCILINYETYFLNDFPQLENNAHKIFSFVRAFRLMSVYHTGHRHREVNCAPDWAKAAETMGLRTDGFWKFVHIDLKFCAVSPFW